MLSSVSAEERLLAAMALAKLAVSLGIIDSEDDMTFISGLEGETMEQIQARRDTLEMVKSAGLSKQKKSVASRVPSMLLTAPSDVMKEEDVPLEAAFIF